MLKALLYKEWTKIKGVLSLAIGIVLFALIYYFFTLSYEFTTIEPETMHWYRAIHIGIMPFSGLIYTPLVIAVMISLAQFLPETVHRKFRIPLHLPISQNKIISFYILSGSIFIGVTLSIFIIGVYFITKVYYPVEVALLSITTLCFYTIGSIGIYGIIAGIIIEPLKRSKVILSLITLTFLFFLYGDEPFSGSKKEILIILLLSITLLSTIFIATFHYKRGAYPIFQTKEKIAQSAFLLLSASSLLLGYLVMTIHGEKIVKNSSKTVYLFYSPTNKEFVYQAHFGNHNFKWGSENGANYTQKEFEETLPFVYYKNLEIQKKLPISIDGKSYSKKDIKKGRQSFKLTPKIIEEDKKRIQIFPLFNADYSIGVIKFPEEFFKIDDKFTILDYDIHGKTSPLTEKFTQQLKKQGFSFPATLIAGKTTNLKPFDEGYFVRDSHEKFFHIKRVNGELLIKEVHFPKNIKVAHIRVSENRKKEFYGTLLDENEKLYLISYDNYKLIPLVLEHYDPKISKLQIFADPIYKIIRYNNKEIMYAVVLDKEYKIIKKYSHKIPQ